MRKNVLSLFVEVFQKVGNVSDEEVGLSEIFEIKR